MDAIDAETARRTAAAYDGSTASDLCAISIRSLAQSVDPADEGTDEEEIDKCDKLRVLTGSVVGKEGADCPGGTEDGDDEED